MQRAPGTLMDEKRIIQDTNRILDFIFQNAMGNPIIFSSAPTAAQMKANTWGKVSGVNTAIYIKFADGGAIKITGTELV